MAVNKIWLTQAKGAMWHIQSEATSVGIFTLDYTTNNPVSMCESVGFTDLQRLESTKSKMGVCK